MEQSTLEKSKTPDELMVEALVKIDGGLGDMLHRELVSTDEVLDLLLDVRCILLKAAPTESV